MLMIGFADEDVETVGTLLKQRDRLAVCARHPAPSHARFYSSSWPCPSRAATSSIAIGGAARKGILDYGPIRGIPR